MKPSPKEHFVVMVVDKLLSFVAQVENIHVHLWLNIAQHISLIILDELRNNGKDQKQVKEKRRPNNL